MTLRGALVLSLALGCTQAGAHAFLDRADPRVGSSVAVAPPEVSLWFSEALEPAFSTLQVMDRTGARVDRADAHLDRVDRQRITVTLLPLGPGDYKVVWRVVSVDAHVTQGDFAFHVGK
jgi:hypothetical protein